MFAFLKSEIVTLHSLNVPGGLKWNMLHQIPNVPA